MVVGFTTTYAISAYHRELKFRSGRGAQHYVIKFVSDLRRVGGFLRFPPPIKLTHDITEILLKVAFNTIKRKKKIYINDFCAIHRLATGSFLIINVL
jgi:hypothetical protein